MLLKPSQLYTTFVSRGLISTMSCLSFIKSKEIPILEKKLSFPPSLHVVDRLKSKWEAPSRVQTPSKGKSHNVESSTKSSVGSPSARKIPSKSSSSGQITKSSVGTLIDKLSFISSTAPIDLTNITNEMEDPIQLR